MLILVGVTINFALNGGIINKAKQASSDYQKAADREELQMAVIASMDYITGEVNFGDLQTNLPNWDVSGSGPATCTSPSGNVFTVAIDGTITENGEVMPSENSSESYSSGSDSSSAGTSEDVDLVKDYFLGKDRTGKILTELFDPNTEKMIDDEDSITDASTTLILNQNAVIYKSSEDNSYYYVTYKNVTYKIEVETTTYETLDVISLAYNTEGNVGKSATINGEKYIVLYDAGEVVNGETILNPQLISANVFAADSLELGNNYDQIDWTDNMVINDANIFKEKDGESDDLTSLEKAIYTYNNAITNLNAKCASVVGNTNRDILDVRCVGSNPTTKNSENNEKYSSTLLAGLPSSDSTYSAGVFNGIGYDTDKNYVSDFDRLAAIGIVVSENSKKYWLASRVVDVYSDHVYFGIRSVEYSGTCYYNGLWIVESDKARTGNAAFGIRPVISLNSSALANYLD